MRNMHDTCYPTYRYHGIRMSHDTSETSDTSCTTGWPVHSAFRAFHSLTAATLVNNQDEDATTERVGPRVGPPRLDGRDIPDLVKRRLPHGHLTTYATADRAGIRRTRTP